ncbi:iron-sulfur cluster biosynthesis family protein [Miniphocaeibacter halophilus]|uniref:Uncharacterized protein n=1 Tax=Miniphocaeibacter halophilus TaxID=2931922 RepID=A0AC61MTK7_9FIRM|nr:iron-sulfur cluster biosynthesis family protein [Miniphocaeibacter halophilus]QQK07980.1 hypothetical protein JFY71_00130 [Miniphocaeibacter halophilus]
MKINITNTAKENLDKILEASGKEYFKLVPGSRSCCDIIFTLVASDKSENDKMYENDKYKFLIEEDLDGIYDKIDVDYITEGFTKGFSIVAK